MSQRQKELLFLTLQAKLDTGGKFQFLQSGNLLFEADCAIRMEKRLVCTADDCIVQIR